MDYSLRRERRRLIEDLLKLEREEDFQQKQRYISRGSERSRHDSYDDEYRNSRHQKKEYSLVQITYQSPNTRQRRYIDEITIIQHNQTLFKGCLKDGDEVTFKSKRYRNESKLKLKFYINDVLKDEMIACCEHGLINSNRRHHLFQIESITGAKPCYDCQSNSKNNNDSRSPSQTSSSSQSSEEKEYSSKMSKSPSITGSASTLCEESETPKKKKSSQSIPETPKNKASSEDFSPNITKTSDINTELNEAEDPLDPPEFPSEPIPSPPQLTTMLSVIESPDLAPPNNQATKSHHVFNSSTNTQQTTANLTNSNPANNTTKPDKYPPRPSTMIDTKQIEPETSNNQPVDNDATKSTEPETVQPLQIKRPKFSDVKQPRLKGNVEYFIIIYLYETEPDESIKKQLRSLANFIKFFNNADECIAFINTISDERIILIFPNTFQRLLIPIVKELQQVHTLYILCESEQDDNNDSPLKPPKVEGFYKDINDTYEPIKTNIDKVSRDLIIYLNTSSNVVDLEQVVEYFLLLNEVLLDKTDTKDDIKELANFARQEYEGNDEELKIIDEFENTYQKDKAVYWFSRPCFISKMINKAFRIPEVEILFRLRLFIQDLFFQIENESITESTTIYLGQTIQRQDLNELEKNLQDNDIIIFPQILFGTTERSVAITTANEIPPLYYDSTPVLIRVEIPEDIKCANLKSERYSNDKSNNILLNTGIIGRITKIEKDMYYEEEDDIARIEIKLTKKDNERNIHEILEASREAIKSFSPFVTLIKLMIKMGQYASAEQLIQTLFNDETLKEDTNFQGSIAASCHLIAQSRSSQEDYKRALDSYLISLDSFNRITSPNAVQLSSLYGDIGSMYGRLENYEKAHEFYQKAIDTQLDSDNPDSYSVGHFTNGVGIVYSKEGKYPEAIESFQRTLKILEQTTESHDAEIAATHEDLGDVYLSQSKYDEALENYSKSLEIEEHIEPRNPQALGTRHHNIGNVYLKLGRSKEALAHLKEAIENFQQVLPATHPTFALLNSNTGLMYLREEEYSEAFKYYSKALEIATESLPDTHPLIGNILYNIGLVHLSEGKLPEAIESMEKSTEQFLKTLPPDHSDIVENKKYIESIKQKQALKSIFENRTKTS